MDDPSQASASQASACSASTTCNIQVFLRTKPCSDERQCLETHANAGPSDEVRYCGLGGEQRFQYDAVGGPECPQEEVWEAVAHSITDQYLAGYNATVFAYGQTGSGKTFTMQGVDNNPGLIQRTFDFLFSRVVKESPHWTDSSVKCTFVEIYNETVYDLLADDENAVKALREDVKRGLVYIEGAREEALQTCDDALAVFRKGAQNRHVAETRMNRESSRSHSIFTLYLSRRRSVNGLEEVLESRFNLVDLAGSERQHSAGTVGVRLKEAGNINKSLLALSNVINALSDSQTNSQSKHVHYRDSKLTFLLRDSLGGNSRTAIVACVSPAWSCQAETLSTLRFAKRAKMITNRAVINQDMRGSMQDLQAEIRRLQGLLAGEKPIHVDCDFGKAGDQFVHKLLERVKRAEERGSLAAQKCQQTEELLKRKEQQLNSERLIIRFRDNALHSLKASLPVAVQDALDEVVELRRLLECPPESVRLQLENTTLRLQLAEGAGRTTDCTFDAEYVRGLEERLSRCTDISMSPIQLNEGGDRKGVQTEEDPVLGEMQAKIDELTDEVASCRAQLGVLRSNHHDELDAAMSRLRQLEDQLAGSNTNFAQLYLQLEALTSSSQASACTIARLQTEHDKLAFKLSNAQDDNEVLLHKLERSASGSLLRDLQSTKERLAELAAENSQLRHENDKLVQHHNTKQKLQYHVKIKQENNDLKTALLAAKEQVAALSAQLHQCRSPHIK